MRNLENRLGVSQELLRHTDVSTQASHGSQQNSVGVISFIAPTEFVYLPSKGEYYPVGHPLRGKESVEIKQMTAKEEDILANKSYIKKGVAIDKLLESLIVDKSIDIDQMLVGDKNALLVAARVSGYGPEYTVGIVCPECQHKFDHEFNLADVLNTSTESSFISSEEVKKTDNATFLVTLPASKLSVEFRLLTSTDEKELVKLMESRRKLNSPTEISIVEQLKTLIVSINGVTDRGQLDAAISNLPARDSRHLRVAVQNVTPNVDFSQEVQCPSCFAENRLEVPMTVEFFWPKR